MSATTRRLAWAWAGFAFMLLVAVPARALTVEPVTSPGGVTAWLVEDHSLKIVSLRLTFRGGSALDPKGKEGLGNLISGLLDEGAGDLDSAAFHARLEALTASFDAQANPDMFTLSSRVQTEDLDGTVELLHLALTAPRFDPEPVARIKNEVLAEIAEVEGNPDEIADVLWRRSVFGEHPYGRSWLGSPDSIGRIEVADLRQFMAQRLARDDVIIGVVGDITPDDLKKLLDKLFAGVPAHAAPDTVPDVTAATTNEVLLSRLPIPQSVAAFGAPGLARDDSDWYAGVLVMHILGGGGFDARLTEEVRVKRGLAYSVDFDLDPLDHAPLILGNVATRNAKVAESIEVIRDQVRRMRDDGPTDAELQAAKTYVTGSFPLDLTSSLRICWLLVTIQRDHLGIDYFDRRNSLFEAVTLDQARRVAKRILDPDKLLFLVVGDPETLPGVKPAPKLE
jgi:zinc protease